MAKRRKKSEDDGMVEPRLEERPVEAPAEEDPTPFEIPEELLEKGTPPPPAADPTPTNGSTGRQIPKVRLRQFLAMSGTKPDQYAGFKFHAERFLRNAAMTIPEWREAFQNFNDRPTGLKR